MNLSDECGGRRTARCPAPRDRLLLTARCRTGVAILSRRMLSERHFPGSLLRPVRPWPPDLTPGGWQSTSRQIAGIAPSAWPACSGGRHPARGRLRPRSRSSLAAGPHWRWRGRLHERSGVATGHDTGSALLLSSAASSHSANGACWLRQHRAITAGPQGQATRPAEPDRRGLSGHPQAAVCFKWSAGARPAGL